MTISSKIHTQETTHYFQEPIASTLFLVKTLQGISMGPIIWRCGIYIGLIRYHYGYQRVIFAHTCIQTHYS